MGTGVCRAPGTTIACSKSNESRYRRLFACARSATFRKEKTSLELGKRFVFGPASCILWIATNIGSFVFATISGRIFGIAGNASPGIECGCHGIHLLGGDLRIRQVADRGGR